MKDTVYKRQFDWFLILIIAPIWLVWNTYIHKYIPEWMNPRVYEWRATKFPRAEKLVSLFFNKNDSKIAENFSQKAGCAISETLYIYSSCNVKKSSHAKRPLGPVSRKFPKITGPITLSGRLSGNFTRPGVAFLEAPVNFPGIYQAW